MTTQGAKVRPLGKEREAWLVAFKEVTTRTEVFWGEGGACGGVGGEGGRARGGVDGLWYACTRWAARDVPVRKRVREALARSPAGCSSRGQRFRPRSVRMPPACTTQAGRTVAMVAMPPF